MLVAFSAALRTICVLSLVIVDWPLYLLLYSLSIATDFLVATMELVLVNELLNLLTHV